MKKLICLLIAVLFVFVCSVSVADDNDPIVGIWCILFTKDNTPPSLWESLNLENNRALFVFDFQPDGEIFAYRTLMSEAIGATDSEFFAKWEKRSDDYLISMIGSIKFKAFFKEEKFYCELFGSDIYLKMEKIEAFDWFEDLIR